MKIKTAELIDRPLDWAVAMALGGTGLWYDTVGTWWIKVDGKDRALSSGWSEAQNFNPSTSWAQGGPIIEREMIDLRKVYSSGRPSTNPYDCWKAEIVFRDEKLVAGDFFAHGPTPLIAAMRCFVTSRLSDEVDVPQELLS